MILEWHPDNAGPMDWNQAIKYCDSLDGNWRLPTIKDLLSIVNYEEFENSSYINMPPYSYWSSTTLSGYPGLSWYVDLSFGGVSNYGSKSNKLYVRAVRNGLFLGTSLDVKEYDPYTDTIQIEGTMYSGAFFRELGCSFPNMVGQTLRVEKKGNGLVTLARIILPNSE